MIEYDSGHTTDGKTFWYKKANGEWLEARFVVSGNNDSEYSAHLHSNYGLFLEWLEEFVILN